MQLRHAMTVLLLIVIATAASAQRAAGGCESLAVSGHHLVLTDAGGKRDLIADARGIELPHLAPSGKLIAYVRPFAAREGEPLSQIVVIDRGGRKVVEIPISEEHGINAVMKLGWLSEGRLWTEGHVNPSVSIYHEWDLRSARSEREVWGTWFAPSPDGKSLAYVELVPPGAPSPHDSAHVMVDDALVYPQDGDTARHVVRHVVWSGASLVFADETAGRTAIVAVDSRTRNVEAKVPIDAMPSSIGPDDANSVDAVIGGKAMRVDLRTGTIAPAVRLRPSAQVVCPQ